MKRAIFGLGFAAILAASSFVAADEPPIRSPQGAGDESAAAITAAKKAGAASAARDIQAEKLRILDYGEPVRPGPRTDSATGYPLHDVGGCVVGAQFIAEVAAYNAVMREWNARHK